MRTSWHDIAVDAIDYEIVRLSEGCSVPELGAFSDVFASEGPPWRLVAGYLMLSSGGGDIDATTDQVLEVCSHGHPVARLELSSSTATWTLATGPGVPADWREEHGVVRGPGIALVPEAGTAWVIEDGSASIERATPWAITVVHGPAESKVDTRLRLLASLRVVGGRHG